MGRNRKRKYPISDVTQVDDANIIPIPNLPEKYLNIKLRSKRVKMKNLLTFALDKCKDQDGILWSAQDKDIEKLISIVEIFKRTKLEFNNQVNKLRFTKLNAKETDSSVETKPVPEIFIYLFKDLNTTEDKKKSELENIEDAPKNLTNEALKSLAELNLKISKKRPNVGDTSMKKDKKKRKSSND